MLGLESLIYDSKFASGVCTVLSHAEIYFLGLIDILTPYDAQKKVASAISLSYTPEEISSVNAQFYCERFLNFVSSVII